jgi:hypothetical protein
MARKSDGEEAIKALVLAVTATTVVPAVSDAKRVTVRAKTARSEEDWRDPLNARGNSHQFLSELRIH